MARINDWRRLYWTNAKGDRTLNRTGDEDGEDQEEFPEEVLAVHVNGRGDRLSLQLAGEDADHKYEVLLNGEPIEEVELGGEGDEYNYDGEEMEVLNFGTRGDAREAVADLQRNLPALEADDEGNYDYDDLQAWAKVIGVSANKGKEALTEEIVGEVPEQDDEAEAVEQ